MTRQSILPSWVRGVNAAESTLLAEWFIGTGAQPSIWLKRVAAELGKPDLKACPLVWVRGRRYKLYNDGRFYDLPEGLAEERRIPPGRGSAEAEAAREKFQTVMDEFTGASGGDQS